MYQYLYNKHVLKRKDLRYALGQLTICGRDLVTDNLLWPNWRLID